MSNELVTTNIVKKTSSINAKVLTWTIFSYLGTLVFIGFGVWSTYYFSLPDYAKDYIDELIKQGKETFAKFVEIWQYTFFPWCLIGLTCLIFAITGTLKLKNTSVGRPKKKDNKKKFGY